MWNISATAHLWPLAATVTGQGGWVAVGPWIASNCKNISATATFKGKYTIFI